MYVTHHTSQVLTHLHNVNYKLAIYKQTVFHPHYSAYTLRIVHTPSKHTKLITYADITFNATYSNMWTAKAQIQPYLNIIKAWTEASNLILNSVKMTCTLSIFYPAKYNPRLNLHINNTILDMNTHLIKLGFNLPTKLTHIRHKSQIILRD